jgi:hypothetical protein
MSRRSTLISASDLTLNAALVTGDKKAEQTLTSNGRRVLDLIVGQIVLVERSRQMRRVQGGFVSQLGPTGFFGRDVMLVIPWQCFFLA